MSASIPQIGDSNPNTLGAAIWLSIKAISHDRDILSACLIQIKVKLAEQVRKSQVSLRIHQGLSYALPAAFGEGDQVFAFRRRVLW